MGGYVESLLGTNEKIIIRRRRHWFTWAPKLLLYLLIAGIIASVSILLGAITGGVGTFAGVFVLLPIALILKELIRWWTEEYIVTNRRIIQSEGFINKRVIDSSLEKINDVVLTQSVLGRVFDYGDIKILTASDIGVNRLEKLAGPVQFKTCMVNAKDALRQSSDGEDAGAAPASDTPLAQISDRIAELEDLFKKGLINAQEYQAKRAELLKRI
ncbi:MAG: PH domain-containing protein [Anaerolineae bacterium]|nr:PH domain-containing protein [Thermoflexales bacterium]MDW8407019.1 PH domain-containing protein [Anaerolineae bacterium]